MIRFIVFSITGQKRDNFSRYPGSVARRIHLNRATASPALDDHFSTRRGARLVEFHRLLGLSEERLGLLGDRRGQGKASLGVIDLGTPLGDDTIGLGRLPLFVEF